jgi:hypothetical protein
MSPRAAKVLGVILFSLLPLGFYWGSFLGAIIAIIVIYGVCESLAAVGLLPPKSSAPGEPDGR